MDAEEAEARIKKKELFESHTKTFYTEDFALIKELKGLLNELEVSYTPTAFSFWIPPV